jgi:peptidoglycan/LPS O-acetylase OafA/YrhL
MPQPTPSRHERLTHLDAVRGLASVAVLCNHYMLAYGFPGNRALLCAPLSFWWDGPAAVSLFFVLSGLVLSLRFFRSGDCIGLRPYCAARACRIMTPYLFVLAVSWLLRSQHLGPVGGGLPYSDWLGSYWSHPLGLKSLVRQAVLFPALDGWRDFFLVPQAWSLATEMSLSLLVPVGVLVAGRGTAWLWSTALAAYLLAGSCVFVLHFAAGMTIARHYAAIIALLRSRRGLVPAVATLGLCLYGWRNAWAHLPALHRFHADDLLPGAGAVLLLVAASSSDAAKAALNFAPVRHVGRVSYSLYLVHMLVLFAVTPRMLRAFPGMSNASSWSVGFAVTGSVSVILALLMYRVIEAPSISLGRAAALWAARRPADTRHAADPASPSTCPPAAMHR